MTETTIESAYLEKLNAKYQKLLDFVIYMANTTNQLYSDDAQKVLDSLIK